MIYQNFANMSFCTFISYMRLVSNCVFRICLDLKGQKSCWQMSFSYYSSTLPFLILNIWRIKCVVKVLNTVWSCSLVRLMMSRVQIIWHLNASLSSYQSILEMWKLLTPSYFKETSVHALHLQVVSPSSCFVFEKKKKKTGVQAKAVETNHWKEEGHSLHQGSTGRWHWELHVWSAVWELCGAKDYWAISHR